MNIKQIRCAQARVWHIYIHIRQYVYKYKKRGIMTSNIVKILNYVRKT